MSHEFAKDLGAVLPPHGELEALVKTWLKSDIPDFDVGGFTVGNEVRTARLLGKSPGVVAGKPFAQAVFDVAGVVAEWFVEDGHVISEQDAAAKKPIATVKGPARRVLVAERTALNILARASGIATLSSQMTAIKKNAGWHGEIAATRKTTPGFALVEKYAVLVGGCSTHRMTLSQMVMLKDNHVWSVGSISTAVRKARSAAGFSCKIEVECRDLEEAREAATAGAEIIMLDNFSTPDDLKKAAAQLKAQWPHILIEASGGITESTVGNYFSPHVDVVSSGKLTQGYGALDFSLKIDRPA